MILLKLDNNQQINQDQHQIIRKIKGALAVIQKY